MTSATAPTSCREALAMSAGAPNSIPLRRAIHTGTTTVTTAGSAATAHSWRKSIHIVQPAPSTRRRDPRSRFQNDIIGHENTRTRKHEEDHEEERRSILFLLR